ncbi:MAG: hypothetical protein J4A00_01560 [Gammaproteobacteria bacterium]|nr:hypothetical protein [Gammaproteobacteria bacterium]
MEYTLPDQFNEIQPLAEEWAFADEAARNHKRRASSMAEIQGFYDAMRPQMDSAMTYLNGFKLADTPEEAKTVLYLALMFMEVSTAVEMYQEVDVPESFPAERYNILSPSADHFMTAG